MDLNTVEDLVAATDGAWEPGDAWLAGGSWLFSEPQPQVRRLRDLHAFGWTPLTLTETGLEIAATCTFAELAAWTPPDELRAGALIGQCCSALLGSFKVWNVATVGGNVCLALPAGPMTSLTSALDGVALVWQPNGGARELPVSELVLGPSITALRPGELLRSITLPIDALRGRTAFRQLSLSPVGRSAAVVIGRTGPAPIALTITITASVPRPLQVRFDRVPDAGELAEALHGIVYYDDVHGDPAWRAHLTRTFAEEIRSELAG